MHPGAGKPAGLAWDSDSDRVVIVIAYAGKSRFPVRHRAVGPARAAAFIVRRVHYTPRGRNPRLIAIKGTPLSGTGQCASVGLVTRRAPRDGRRYPLFRVPERWQEGIVSPFTISHSSGYKHLAESAADMAAVARVIR